MVNLTEKIGWKKYNIFWQLVGLIIAIKLIFSGIIIFGIVSAIILIIGISMTILLPENLQPKILKPVGLINAHH